MSDLIENLNCWFSQVKARMIQDMISIEQVLIAVNQSMYGIVTMPLFQLH